MEKGRIKVRDINDFLTCSLCNGYLIDATTIVECLHSFCRTCIVHYLHTSIYCPRCECVVHKKFPHQNIRSDRLLQDIVYKIVPGLFKEELRRRQEYFIKNNHPKDDWEQVSRQSRKRFFSQDDKISLCLEFSPRKLEEEDVKTRRLLKEDNRRYLLCPAKLTIRLLKKFLQNKFSLDSNMKIDMWCAAESLADEFTLIDVAYVVRWKRKRPMRIHYCIYENRCIDPGKETVSAFANSPAQDSGIEDESPSFELSSEDPIIFADPDDVNWDEYENEAAAAEASDCDEKKKTNNLIKEKQCKISIIEQEKGKQEHIEHNLENENELDEMTDGTKNVDVSEPNKTMFESSENEEQIEGVIEENDIDEATKDPCSVLTREKVDHNSEEESAKSCSDLPLDRDKNITPKKNQEDVIEEKANEEGNNVTSDLEHNINDGMDGECIDKSEKMSADSSPDISPLVIDMQSEQTNDDEAVRIEEKETSAEKSELIEEESVAESEKNLVDLETGNATVDKSEQTELEEEEDVDSGPSFNDSGAQTSPYYEEDPDAEESEEIWNESAIDLSKPKMIVIEPLLENIGENRGETIPENDDKLAINTHYSGYCENVPTVKIEETPRNDEDDLEDVQEYNYVADGIEEVEGARTFHHEEYTRPKHDLIEHSYSMMPNLEPRDCHSNIILKQRTGKAIITIPGSFPGTSVNRAISPVVSLSKHPVRSEIIIPSPSKVMTTFKSPRSVPITKRKRKHETKSNSTKIEKSMCKKSRKCTNVCNGHSVPQRSEKLVVKLSKSRNSNSYTATMT